MTPWIATGPAPVGEGPIEAAMGLVPEAARHARALLGAVSDGALPLTPREREMVTTVVSAANRCHT